LPVCYWPWENVVLFALRLIYSSRV
jgi:hypothetical protein